jgi:hypothetical protein
MLNPWLTLWSPRTVSSRDLWGLLRAAMFSSAHSRSPILDFFIPWPGPTVRFFGPRQTGHFRCCRLRQVRGWRRQDTANQLSPAPTTACHRLSGWNCKPFFPPFLFRSNGRSSVCLSACGYRPERLHFAVADADIPVVHVASRVAVPRHESQLVIDLQHALAIVDDAVLV